MKKDRLIYMPLGGAGEIGMNAYLYGFGAPGRERFILVDIGVGFPDMESCPGVDLILPDLSWLCARKERLEAVFITHGHEDHVGALGHFAKELDAPIYCRPFAAALGEQKCERLGLEGVPIHVVRDCGETLSAGPFGVRFVPVSHSIPQAASLVIETPVGRILHSGDFKIDTTPVVGDGFDQALFEELARPGIKALVCDSTNIFSTHEGRSESTVRPALERHIANAKGLVVATTFASNVARLKSLALAGKKAGRSLCFLGRAVERMVALTESLGMGAGFPSPISAEEAAARARKDVMLIVTGSQGEPRAASAQLSQARYRGLQLQEGDTFIFSSKTIPGNERAVINIVNNLSKLGVDVIDDEDNDIHVSGHANRPDLERFYSLVKPEMVIPMHGEHRHLREHARFARERGMRACVATNGVMVDLTQSAPEIIERIDYVRNYLDGSRIIGAKDGVIRDRLRLARDGVAMVSLILGGAPSGEADDIFVQTMGLCADDREVIKGVETALRQFLQSIDRDDLDADDVFRQKIKRISRNMIERVIGKKPRVLVSLAVEG